VWVPISSTNTSRPGSMRPTSMRHSTLKNSSRSTAPWDLFFGSCALASAPDRPSLRLPKPPRWHTGTRLSGSGWPTASVRGLLRGASWPSRPALWGSAGSLPRLERPALVELLAVAALVAFDRGAIDPEASGSLCLGNSFLERLYDLLSEIQRICTHASTIPGAPSSQSAVRVQGLRGRGAGPPRPGEGPRADLRRHQRSQRSAKPTTRRASDLGGLDQTGVAGFAPRHERTAPLP
jgi:hypothetical protein